ncbi:MAG TPA: hypothetical protein VFB99_01495, partial [Vicinamibacterales bacterium]|nr:hypothetical protein [Vicinamibacterales bacterium]
FDAQGWYLRHSEAVVWLNQSTVPGHVQMARLRDRRKDRYQTSAPACSKRSSLGHPSEDRARFRGENGRV